MTEPATQTPGARSRREVVESAAKFTKEAASTAEASITESHAFIPAMRSSRNRRRIDNKALPSMPPLALIALNRMGFGPRSGDVVAFNALGGNDTARLTNYVDQQLDPQSISDAVADTRLAIYPTLTKSLQQLWNDHFVNDQNYNERIQPIRETELATFVRAIYSKRQLLEVLADFWHNHFNVMAWDYRIESMFVHYDRDVIHGHALGNFRQMLQAVAQSPAMLYYLDNYTSSNAGPNENFSRELFELHAMGAENYLGVMQQNQVPIDGTGKPTGYVDADVYEATRAFTGWTVDDGCCSNNGTFTYLGERHDRFQKSVLGVFMPADQAQLKDGLDVLDALASHPGTARYICRKLCRRLVADDPPQSLVDQAAAVFQAQSSAPDQLAQVVRTILLSTEFRTTWGQKVKRPFEIAVSAIRAGAMNLPWLIGNSDINSFFYRYDRAGQELFRWPAPNGYPDTRAAWTSNSPRAMSWRMVNWLVDARDDNDVYYLDAVAQTPNHIRSATALADHWIQRLLRRPIDPAERQTIIDFMAQGYNPDYDLPIDSHTETRERLQSMIGLIFMSPAFLWR